MVAREGVEEVIITAVSLAIEGVEIQGLDVNARRLPPGSGNAGARALTLPQRLLDRLPLPDFDPALVAALSPNVILTAGDTASDLSAFSVGLSEEQIARIEEISATLDERVAATIEQVQERLDASGGGDPQAQLGALREVQPLLQEGREAIGDAMEQIEDVLTDDQWDMVPGALKNPVGRGGRGR